MTSSSQPPAAPMEQQATPRWRRWLPLALALMLLVPWNLWAIVVDDTPSQPADSLSLRVGGFYEGVLEGDPEKAWRYLVGIGDKIPPLSVLICGLLVLLLGPSLTALRLGGVLCHLVMMWQSHDLARRAGASSATAGVAAFFCGVVPVLFGWCRLAYADVYVAVFLLGTLQVMARGVLTRRRAVVLGLMGGLGVLCKLSFFAHVLAPAAYFALAHLRRRERLLNLALAVGVALLVCGWWLVLQFDTVYKNFFDST